MTLPKILDIGFQVDEPKLWALGLPVEEIDILELEHNLDIPYLEQEGTNDWNLTPRMLIQNWERETFHALKARKADINYPIYIFKNGDSWIILDGVHRFTKLVKDGKKKIQVKKVPKNLIDKIKRTDIEYKKWKGE